jgi:hypothetical protein
MREICKAVFSRATVGEWKAGYRSGKTRAPTATACPEFAQIHGSAR